MLPSLVRIRMRPLHSALVLACCLTHRAAAQTTVMRHVVQGVVFDSVANRPLADATVQLAAREGPGAPLTATSDASGRYHIANVAPGRYVLGFYHDALTALGLDAPVRSLEVGSDTLVMADLAVPASRTIRTLRCGESAFESSSGMMVGFVRDAEQRAAVPGAKLQLAWRAFALDAGNYRTVTERATATIEDDGSYLACHLPIDTPLDLQVTGPGHRAVGGTAAVVPTGGIGRLDVALADSAIERGSAMIRGRVTRSSGKAVSTGRAAIASLGREVPIEAGTFVLGDLPQGTWVVETRVMGSDPQSVLVNANDSAATSAAITVADQAQHLDAVTVVGKKDANALLLDEVLRRKRIGMGTVFLPGSPALKSAVFTSDVMREARGFIYRGPTQILARATAGGGGCSTIAVFVDDMLQPYGFDGLDLVSPPSEVLAIETYPDILLAPIQYRISKTVLGSSAKYCAVVLVWTKNRPRG